MRRRLYVAVRPTALSLRSCSPCAVIVCQCVLSRCRFYMSCPPCAADGVYQTLCAVDCVWQSSLCAVQPCVSSTVRGSPAFSAVDGAHPALCAVDCAWQSGLRRCRLCLLCPTPRGVPCFAASRVTLPPIDALSLLLRFQILAPSPSSSHVVRSFHLVPFVCSTLLFPLFAPHYCSLSPTLFDRSISFPLFAQLCCVSCPSCVNLSLALASPLVSRSCASSRGI